MTNLPYEYNPVLASIGHALRALLQDQSLLRHAAPRVRGLATTRRSGTSSGSASPDLITLVSERSGVPATDLREFFAQGMLMNVAAAMQLDDSALAWDVMCEGVAESRRLSRAPFRPR